MRNELIKVQYRLDQLKDDAQAVADKLFSFIRGESVLNGENAIVEAGQVAAHAIVEANAQKIIEYAVNMVRERQPVDVKVIHQPMELLAAGLGDNFVNEMEVSGKVCLMDIKQWAERSMVMGSNQEANIKTVNKAYIDGTPPLFSDHDKRVKQAITAWHHAMFQGAVSIAQGASVVQS
jgi:hypothetical protein